MDTSINIQQYMRVLVTLLAVINPMICGVMLLQIDRARSIRRRVSDATKAALSIFAILIITSLLGRHILGLFAISIDTFKIVGGVIIAFIGFGMFDGKSMVPEGNGNERRTMPELVMFAASPGTLSTTITLSVVHDFEEFSLIALAGITGAVFITWLVMIGISLAAGHFENKWVQQMLTRFMGLILIAMGLQYVLSGLKDFMTA